MIGDSIMASTSSRYGGEMCQELVPRGWHVEMDAESGRFVDFGDRVLDSRLDAEWDAAVVMLGNNYGADKAVFDEYLADIVDRLAPRPTVLLTVTEFRPDRADVNDTIYDIAAEYDNVRVVDWAAETAADAALVGGDGLHLSDLGPGPLRRPRRRRPRPGARLRRGRLPRLRLHRRLGGPPARPSDPAPEPVPVQQQGGRRWRSHDATRPPPTTVHAGSDDRLRRRPPTTSRRAPTSLSRRCRSRRRSRRAADAAAADDEPPTPPPPDPEPLDLGSRRLVLTNPATVATAIWAATEPSFQSSSRGESVPLEPLGGSRLEHRLGRP